MLRAEAYRELLGLVERDDVLGDDDELVASEARGRVAGPQTLGEALRDGDQQLVAGVMAQRSR